MPEDNGWRHFFDNYAPQYLAEPFTANTIAEADFIEAEFRLPRGASILDVGCGAGRHSVELAKRGYHLTGLDLSSGMLREAQKGADAAGVRVEFIQADAADFKLDKRFDACICLCEGAFGLLSMDEDPFTRDLRILCNINKALQDGGRFLLTALNGLRMARAASDEDVAAGRFDPLALAEIHPLSSLWPDVPGDMMVKEKGFLATELIHLLTTAGFAVEHVWGGTAGAWLREPLRLEEMELMVISHKNGGPGQA